MYEAKYAVFRCSSSIWIALVMPNTMTPAGKPEQPNTMRVTAMWYRMFSRFIDVHFKCVRVG